MVTDHTLLLACKGSYNRGTKLKGYDSRVLTSGNDSCTIYFNSTDIIIAFAGTDDIADVIVDMKFIKIKTPYGRIHRGFVDSYKNLEIYIQGILHVLYSNKEKHVYICGHSLGGALALICAINFIYRPMIKKVVTFGCPRVGNRKWKKIYNNITTFPTIRYVNGDDIITKIPKLFYYHVGILKIIKCKTKTKNYWGFIRDFFMRKLKSTKDHKIDSYIKNF